MERAAAPGRGRRGTASVNVEQTSIRHEAPTGSTEPLPALEVRRWSRVAGFAFFAWAITAASALTVVCALLALSFMWFIPGFAWSMPRFWAASLLFVSGVKVETTYEQPLPEGPVIFISNHQGNFDILSLFVGLGRPFVFVAKKSVFRYPFLGWYITAAKYISVDRGDRGQSIRSLERAGDKIREGTSVAVFAEGTRSADGSILPFKKGAFMVAMKARVPLVPVAIEGSLQVNPKRRWYVCPNTIRILVGPAYPMAQVGEQGRDQVMHDLRSTVIRLHRRLGGLGGDEANAIAAAGLEGIARADSAGTLR